MKHIRFTTLVGTGNDFVLVDTIRHQVKPPTGGWPALARILCDRRQTGTDGLLLLGKSRRADISMRIFNPDGSEASMCGNGVRCLAWYAKARGVADECMTIETGAGIKRAHVRPDRNVRVDMGVPKLLRQVRPAGAGIVRADLMDSGVPHLVCWVRSVDRIDVERVGGRLRRDARFRPAGANVDFVQEIGRRAAVLERGVLRERVMMKMRTYERGVEGETQACGTGAVASAAAAAVGHAFSRSLQDPMFTGSESNLVHFDVDVQAPGGMLHVGVAARRRFTKAQRQHPGRAIDADPAGLVFSHAFLLGEVREVSTGSWSLNGRRA